MRSTRRIGFLLALVFLLPALFFSVYEISSFNKDEKMIQEIYSKQLEAILFSVNQYSDDILNNWISKIEAGLTEQGNDAIPAKINDLLTFNSSLGAILVYDSVVQRSFAMEGSLTVASRLSLKLREAIPAHREQIDQLMAYKRSGFQKVEVLAYDWGERENKECLIFITGYSDQPKVVALFVDPVAFILDLVGPRLQAIAKDQFILAAFDKKEHTPLYSTIATDVSTVKSEALTKDFWLFPDYVLGIRTKGSSIEKLVAERTATNLILLLSLDVILIIAVILVFRNVKKEVQLAQNKADFVSNVSHEIRTPLALISMFAETLEMGRVKSDEKRQEYYHIISKETQRLSGIVNKILNFSQAEANKKTFHIQPVRVNAVINEILTTYDFHLRNKGFEYIFNDQADVWVKADKEAMVESVINLIDNAVKYSAETKRIEITTGTENTFGVITVKDAGVGISAADQKHIFDKFYRVSSGDLAKSRGTGLGLSLVKQLMEAHQGNVSVVSAPGKGSTFTLYFPLHHS